LGIGTSISSTEPPPVTSEEGQSLYDSGQRISAADHSRQNTAKQNQHHNGDKDPGDDGGRKLCWLVTPRHCANSFLIDLPFHQFAQTPSASSI
jgi:hypothetical protein